jgi:segregation and condensation protein A
VDPVIKRDSAYNIKHNDIFNGPIDLLLELVQKKKVDIYDVSLSYIIKGFSDFIKEKKTVLLETISSFIYFSSVLLEIKSRSLLPSRKIADEDQDELDINILKRREEEYRVYKKVSNYISSKIVEESLYFIREAPMEKDLLDTLPDFMEELDITELWLIASKLFMQMKLEIDLIEVYTNHSTVNIFEEMERIKDILNSREDITFKEISSAYNRVLDRIISFLSILELYKSEEIEIIQFENFGNIVIKAR